MFRKALGGLAGIVAFSVLAGSAHATYPGINGDIVYEHKTGQFATKSNPFTITPGVAGSASRLAKFSDDVSNFVYSPSGKKIAFQVEDSDFPAQIFVINSNGTKPKSVTAKAKPCLAEEFPTWSPDGKTIAFRCLRKSDLENEVYSIKVDGTGLKRLTTDGDVYQPSWSPLGDKIAYVTFGHAIKTVPAGGGEDTLVDDDAPGITGVWGRVDYAPNGLVLVAESTGAGVYTLPAVGGAESSNLAPAGLEPVFSPDGTKILYVGVAESSGSQLDLWMMNVNGTGKQAVTANGYDRAPNWGVAP